MALAAALASAVFMVVAAVRDTVPFGTASRGVDDLGNQTTPYYSALHALLHGQGHSDWQWNWASGGGVPFLPDYGTYLSNPLVLLIGLFPKDRLDTAVFAIIVLRIAVAAVLMSLLLMRLSPAGSTHRGRPAEGTSRATPWWVAALLGTAYACSAWVFNDAEYQPHWLDGLAALPAFTLVALQARARTWPVLGTLVIAWFWWCNYYSAFMASLGAAVFLVIISAARGESPRAITTSGLRFLAQGLLGVALTALLLVPSLLTVVLDGQTAPGALGAAPWGSVAVRMLPLSEGVSASPSLFVGTGVLLLAASVPFHRALPRSARIAYPAGAALLLLSMQWPPTQLVWSAFDDPNGSAFRASFVFSGLLVVMAWEAVATTWPGPRTLLGGAACIGVVLMVAALGDTEPVQQHPLAVPLALAVALVMGGGLSLLRWRPRWAPAVVAPVLTGVLVFELVGTGAWIEDRREELIHAQPTWASLTALHPLAQRAATEGDWPRHRVSGHLGPGNNRSALAQVPSFDYYSTANTTHVAGAAMGLGAPWALYGRAVFQPDHTLAALLGANVLYDAGNGTGTATAQRQPAMPMVSVVASGDAGGAAAPVDAGDGDPFIQRNRLVSVPVYEVPAVRVKAGSVDGEHVVSFSCAPGTHAELFAPSFAGTWAMGAERGAMRAPDPFGLPRAGGGVQAVGTVPTDGRGRITLTRSPAQSPRQRDPLARVAIGCLDPALLATQARSADEALAEVSIDGGAIRARWTQPATGDAVIATAAQPGWSCTADGQPAPVSARAGMMAVPIAGASELHCTYRTPGLLAGAATTAAALLLVGVALATRLPRTARARRQD